MKLIKPKLFFLMNDISYQLSENYIKEKMKIYGFIAKHFNLPIKIIKNIFKTQSYLEKRKKIYGKIIVYKILFYDLNIYLTRENIRKRNLIINFREKRFKKYAQLNFVILNIVKKFNKIFSAKTISGILKKFYNIKISYNHLYFIIKNNYLKNIRSTIFPYLKFGLYQNK